MKFRKEGPELLYEKIEEFIDTYAETDEIRHLLDFLVNMDYQELFSVNEFSDLYLQSSLFYKLETYFFDVLSDIVSHVNSEGSIPLKFKLSKIGL